MPYPLTRKALITCLNRLKDSKTEDILKDEEFLFYHKNRNYFNILYDKDETKKPQLMRLVETKQKKIFKDNLGRIWQELTGGIIYHRPFKTFSDKLDYLSDFRKSRKERFCRKFISVDEYAIEAGYAEGSEFELIIRYGKRLIDGPYMETYNFGRSNLTSTLVGLHGKFDVEPHKKTGAYESKYYKEQRVEIIDNEN